MKLAVTASAVALMLSCSGPATGQTRGALTEDEAAEMAIQPGAVRALDSMAAFLRTLKDFRVSAEATRDDVLGDGQKVQIASTSTYDVRVPNKLKLDYKSDQKWRVYYYDGNTVSQYSPGLALYSVFPTRNTIAAMLEDADRRFGIQLPLADLFYWNTERSTVEGLTSAFFVGESRIDGKRCDHYAYRANAVDFQIWIASAGDPLPCRLVITTTDDPARPEYEATLDWDLKPLLDDTMFSFAPANGVTLIEQELLSGNDAGAGDVSDDAVKPAAK